MAIVDYTLDEIRDRLREEFGIDDTTPNNDIIDKRINDAVLWVVRSRPNWPWMRKEHTIDVPVATTDTVTFTSASRTVTGVTGPALRQIINPETSGTTPSIGYMIADVTGPVLIDQQWTSATEAKASRIVAGFFQLPDDFIRVDKAPLIVESLRFPHMKALQPTTFNDIKHAGVTTVSKYRYYTVVKDPIESETFAIAAKFLAVYPYIADLEVIKLKYWRAAPVLSADGDIPIVPWEDRLVVWWAASWFVAQWQEDDRLSLYRDSALNALQDMKNEYSFADDENEDSLIFEDHTGFIYPPSGYEDFNRSY